MNTAGMGKLMRWFRRGEAGQSLVEAAVAAPMFFLLLMGAGELARVAYVAIEVSNAARAGAQYGAQSSANWGDSTGIATAASEDAANVSGLTTTSSTGNTCSDGTAATSSNGTVSCASGAQPLGTVTVTSSASFDPLIHIPGLPTTMNLSSSATETCGDCL